MDYLSELRGDSDDQLADNLNTLQQERDGLIDRGMTQNEPHFIEVENEISLVEGEQRRQGKAGQG